MSKKVEIEGGIEVTYYGSEMDMYFPELDISLNEIIEKFTYPVAPDRSVRNGNLRITIEEIEEKKG